MHYLHRIQRGIDYIEARLEDEIDLRGVSKAAGISHAHFQRIFKALTGETLLAYVRARRMAKALGLLRATDRRVLDIAIEAGFESQEAFARAFKRAFGMTPTAFRKLGHGNLFLEKVRIGEAYLAHIGTAISLEPTMVERPATTTLGMRTVFYGRESEKNNLADKLPPLWAGFLARTGELRNRIDVPYYGVIRPDLEEPERLEYFATVEVRPRHPPPPGMVELEIPAGRYAVFEHRGPTESLDTTVDYIYGSWLPRAEHRHTWGPDLELYGPQWSTDGAKSVMHYAVPVQ